MGSDGAEVRPQTSSGESTLQVVGRARIGDPEALDQICRRYLPLLRRWASGRIPRRARDIVDTDDIVQETIVAAIRNLGGLCLEREGALAAYLRQAIHNRLTNESRRAARNPLETASLQSIPDPRLSPLDEAISLEAVDRYDRALATLRPIDREAVIARLELGLDYNQVAALLGKPSAAAARVGVARAVARLAREMDRA